MGEEFEYELDPFNDADLIDDELTIHNESLFALEKEVMDHPRKSAKYHRFAALAVREVDIATLQLEVYVAELVKDILSEAAAEGKPIPPSAQSEIRRVRVPLDHKYKKLRRKVIDVTARANLFKGLVYSWSARSKRMEELVRLSERTLWNEPSINLGSKKERVEDRVGRAEQLLDAEEDES